MAEEKRRREGRGRMERNGMKGGERKGEGEREGREAEGSKCSPDTIVRRLLESVLSASPAQRPFYFHREGA